MKQTTGDLFSFSTTHKLVIPTNIGWNRQGIGIMGRGVALQAAERNPGFAEWWGKQCQVYLFLTPVLEYNNYVSFPTKPLNEKQPWLSWQNDSTLELVERSTKLLKQCVRGNVALPLVGCGNGGLSQKDVIPLLKKHLTDDRFLLVM